jgi:hypothetical protein
MMSPSNRDTAMNSRKFAFVLAFAILVSRTSLSQTCGNPAGTAGNGQTTISLSGAYQTLADGKQTFQSYRLFFKAMQGLAPWLDVYGLVGGTRVKMNPIAQGIASVQDRSRLAYGAGFNLLLNPTQSKRTGTTRGRTGSARQGSVGFWGGANIIRYPAEAVYSVSSGAVIHEYRMKHDFREITGHAGILIPFGTLKLYAGAVGWAVQRLDKKSEYLLGISTDPIHKGDAKATYQSGLWTGGISGLQVDLPRNYALTLEVIAFNKDYYQVMIGISQTGIRAW